MAHSATEDLHFTRSMRGGQGAASEVDICLHHLAAIKNCFYVNQQLWS